MTNLKDADLIMGKDLSTSPGNSHYYSGQNNKR